MVYLDIASGWGRATALTLFLVILTVRTAINDFCTEFQIIKLASTSLRGYICPILFPHSVSTWSLVKLTSTTLHRHNCANGAYETAITAALN